MSRGDTIDLDDDRRRGPGDPYFGLPLVLQVPCCGRVLWAYNARHLEYLAAVVSATLRERNCRSISSKSLSARLPRWMKDAKNREEVIDGIDTLRRMLRA